MAAPFEFIQNILGRKITRLATPSTGSSIG
jgi:hypothetical protein